MAMVSVAVISKALWRSTRTRSPVRVRVQVVSVTNRLLPAAEDGEPFGSEGALTMSAGNPSRCQGHRGFPVAVSGKGKDEGQNTHQFPNAGSGPVNT